MADNFNFKQFLAENKLGAYSKTGKLNEGFNDHQDINMGDESDAPPIIKNPRNPREVAAEIKAQNPSIGQDADAIKAAAESIMVAAFHAQGLNMGKAMTATRILLGGTHPTYSEFPRQLYDAVTGGGIEEDGRWLPKGAPGDTFRGRYSQQDAEYRKQKALDAVEYPKSGLQFKTFTALYNYADKAGVDLHTLAKQSPTVDSFIGDTASKVKGFNSPKIVSVLKKYYSDIKK